MHPFTTLTLATDRLTLRPVAPADAQALFAIFAEPDVTRYGSYGPWTDVQRAHDHIARNQREAAEGASVSLGLFRRSDDVLVGTATLFHVDAQCRRAEIGYSLAPSAWGQGLATEAVVALLAYGFDEMRLNRVEADIDPINVASARVLERQGFQREGLLRERWIVDGRKSDSAMYGLLAADYAARRGR